jgi:hypothetical protein
MKGKVSLLVEIRECLGMGMELTSARSLATTSDSDSSSCAGISAGKPEKIQHNYKFYHFFEGCKRFVKSLHCTHRVRL